MKINPLNGIIEANINATSLFDLQDEHANVLNGIAWDEAQQGFLLTGKNWSFSYLVNFSEGDSEYSLDSSIGPGENASGEGLGNNGETTNGEENWKLAEQSIGFFIAITLLLLAVLLLIVWLAAKK